MKASGCDATMPNGSSATLGKCRKLMVTMTLAPTCIAAATTCSIIGVRQDKLVDNVLIVDHACIVDVKLHELARALQLRGRQVAPVAREVCDPFFVDAIGPARLI